MSEPPAIRNVADDSQMRIPALEKTKGLIDALDKFEQVQLFLKRLQGSAARRALNVLDNNMEPGPEREVVRREILDAMGFFRREIQEWLKSQSEPTQEIEEKT